MGTTSITPSQTCVPNNLKMSGPGLMSKSKQAGLASSGIFWRSPLGRANNRICPVDKVLMANCVSMKNC